MARVRIGLILAVAVVGCVPHTAQLHTHVRRGDVALELDVAHAHGNDAVLLLTVKDVPPDVVLLEATIGIAENDSLPCTGARATALGRTSGRDAAAPLMRGEKISLAFEDVEPLLAPGPRLQLLVATPGPRQHCLTFPIVSAGEEVRWQPDRRWTIGVDFSLEGFTSRLGAVQQIVTVPVSAGVWVDRFHLRLGAGIAASGCPDTHCEVTEPDMRIAYTSSVPIVAGVDYLLWERGEFGVGAAIRYRAMRLTAETYTGFEAFWMHGPVLAPFFAVVSSKRGGWHGIGGARSAMITVEVPVGLAFTPEGDSLSIGANVGFHFTVL